MAVNPVARHGADKGQGEKQEANHLIPKGVKRFYHSGDNMPDELNAVFYNPAFDHIFMVPKLSGTLISRPLPVDRRVTAPQDY
jgi:hypothetical protein